MAAPSKNANGLTQKQQAFCDFYLVDIEHNQTQAYLKAYPNVKKEATAAAAATRMLKNVNVDNYIKKRQAEMQRKAEISQERVLEEEKCIAFQDPALITGDELPEELRRAISGFEIIETETAGVKTTKRKYKFCDKGRSLERLEKHLGMFEKDNQQKGVTFEQLITTLKSLDPGFADRVCEELANSISG